MRIVAAGFCLLALNSCQRERRDLRPAPASVAVFGDAGSESQLQPGGMFTQPSVPNPDHGVAADVAEGSRLFGVYNCTGCHANGGGGIGPPLMKISQADWIYGGAPANIFDTIIKGRPNGMPAWGSRIPEYQVWQLVTFIRSMNHDEPNSVTPPRSDHIEPDPHTLFPPKGFSK